MWHVVRALTTDRLLRHWLARYPDGQVVALGEGLETQYYRVDTGQLQWLAVDLPEVIAIRRGVIPDTNRHRNLAGSALDVRWMAHLAPTRPVMITAVGLLKYFQPQDVRQLIATIAGTIAAGGDHLGRDAARAHRPHAPRVVPQRPRLCGSQDGLGPQSR